jgi:ubiquitin carboxyl-terminal hydrolase 8
VKSSGSLTDRLRALRESGMDVSTIQEKRVSRDGPSPVLPNQDEIQIRNPSPISPLPRFPDTLHSQGARKSNSNPFSTDTDNHTFVPASALGPPSPLSSPASSPRSSHFNISLDNMSKQISMSSTSSFKPQSNSPPSYPLEFSHFTQHFPSITELDELNQYNLPTVPTTIPGTKPAAGPSNGIAGNASADKGNSEMDSWSSRSFPMPPVTPIPRPSSTPITPTHNTFVSRSPSPERPGIPLRAGTGFRL